MGLRRVKDVLLTPITGMTYALRTLLAVSCFCAFDLLSSCILQPEKLPTSRYADLTVIHFFFFHQLKTHLFW